MDALSGCFEIAEVMGAQGKAGALCPGGRGSKSHLLLEKARLAGFYVLERKLLAYSPTRGGALVRRPPGGAECLLEKPPQWAWCF